MFLPPSAKLFASATVTRRFTRPNSRRSIRHMRCNLSVGYLEGIAKEIHAS